MKRVLAAAVAVLGLPLAPSAQRQDFHSVVQQMMPGFRIAEAKDYVNQQAPQISLRDEGGQLAINKDFDGDGRSDWAVVAIDPASHLGRACLFLNQGSSYRARILREWTWDGLEFYSLHPRDGGKATPDELAESRFAPLVSDTPLASFTAADRRKLQDLIKRYASGPSVTVVQYQRCLGCDLSGRYDYFFDGDTLRVINGLH